jgi:chromosomal replication initiator protein
MDTLKSTFDYNKNGNWIELKNLLKREFGENLYNSWLSKLNIVSFTDNEIIMSVSTPFVKEWILKEFLNGRKKVVNEKEIWIKKGIKQIFIEKYPSLKSIEIIVNKKAIEEKIEYAETNNESNKISSISEHNNLYALGTDLNPDFTFENFVIGNSNKLAYSVARSIAESTDLGLNANPFFIYSGMGLGKTHLLQAIAWKLKENNPKQQIIYLSAEKFMYLFIQALRNQDIMTFKARFANIDVLLIDDIHFIAGKDSTQKEFLYTFNALIGDNKKIILACDKSPNDLEGIDEKLKSRISGGIIADIFAPDYETRLKITKKKAQIIGLNCDENIYEYIAETIATNARDIDGALKKVLLHQKFVSPTLDLTIVKNLLKDLVKNINKNITIELIQEAVAQHYKIKKEDILSKKRTKLFVLPRQIAMSLAKLLTTKSLPDIGKAFRKNHATVIHAINKIAELKQIDFEINQVFEKIVEKLNK